MWLKAWLVWVGLRALEFQSLTVEGPGVTGSYVYLFLSSSWLACCSHSVLSDLLYSEEKHIKSLRDGIQNWKMITSDQIRSVVQSCLTICNPMNRSTPGLPVHHQLPEFTQTHVHRVGDAIQPSHPLSSPSPPAPNPSQHQSLFQ